MWEGHDLSSKQHITSEHLSRPAGVFCHAVRVPAATDLLFLSGLTARNPDGSVAHSNDIEGQTRLVLEHMRTLLSEVGAGLEDVVKVVVYVKDMEGFDVIHRVRAEYFPGDPPASTMISVAGFVKPEMLIEIDAVAAIPAAS